MTTSTILGPDNQQLTELTWTSNSGPSAWANTNVFAAG
jgi:hypothetical protein